MSGGCCSPLGPGTGPVAAFRIQDDGSPLPEEAALNIIGGTLADNPGNGSTDLTLHYQSVADDDGAFPLEPELHFRSQDFVLLDEPGTDTRVSLRSPISTNVGVNPFRATFHVDPTFAGLAKTGSEANPFTTVAAAFAAAAALSLTSGIIKLAPGINLVENIVFPTSGAWGLVSGDPTGTWQTLITGTVTMNAVAAAQYAIEKIDVEGNVSGNISAGLAAQFNYVRFVDCFVDGTVTLTSSAAASWTCEPLGRGRRGPGGEDGFQLACAVTGRIIASGWTFSAPVTWSAPSQFDYSNLPTTMTSSAASTVQITDSFFPAATSFVSSAGLCTVTLDDFTTRAAMSAGITTSGAGTFSFFSSGGSSGTRQTLAGNAGTFTLSNRYPRCQIVVDVALTLLVPGTSGAIQAVVGYTDATGTLRSRNVGATLAVNGAAGDFVSAQVSWTQNGASNITLNLGGVITPGALSYEADVSVRVAS